MTANHLQRILCIVLAAALLTSCCVEPAAAKHHEFVTKDDASYRSAYKAGIIAGANDFPQFRAAERLREEHSDYTAKLRSAYNAGYTIGRTIARSGATIPSILTYAVFDMLGWMGPHQTVVGGVVYVYERAITDYIRAAIMPGF